MAGIAANQTSAIGSPMGGGTQIIQGKTYQQYSPEWYEAMRQGAITSAGAHGTAAGTQAASALAAMSPSLNGLMSAAGSGSGGTGAGGTGGGVSVSGSGINAGSQVPGVAPIDTSKANAAAFSKAKDTAGQVGRASLDALRGELGATGALGGGAEVQGTRDIMENAAGGLRNVANEQAINDVGLAERQGATNYQGAITQRGQDIAAQEAQARLAMQQNQLAWQRQMQALQMAFSGLNSDSSASGYTY